VGKSLYQAEHELIWASSKKFLMKQLVFCANDFALRSAASEGIALLAHKGCLTDTSVMVLSPSWARDAALLQPL
jgi:hypothetical protein